jgi:hypothetical protein
MSVLASVPEWWATHARAAGVSDRGLDVSWAVDVDMRAWLGRGEADEAQGRCAVFCVGDHGTRGSSGTCGTRGSSGACGTPGSSGTCGTVGANRTAA